MDLRLFLAVIKRFKKLALGGLLLAVVLAGLAYVSHGPETWQAQSEVLISETSQPYIRANPPGAGGGDESYLAQLSNVYAGIANADAIQRAVQRATGVTGTVQASEVIDPATGNPEPLMTLTSSALSAVGATKLAAGIIPVLEKYIESEQQQAQLPLSQRTDLVALRQGLKPELSGKSLMTTTMLVFAGVIAAVLVLIFTLENSNPRTAEALRSRSQDLLRPHEVVATAHNGRAGSYPATVPVRGIPGRAAMEQDTEQPAHADVADPPTTPTRPSLQGRLLRSRP